MIKKLIFPFLSLIMASTLYAQEYSFPQPPPEFFEELSKTELPPGKTCCNRLRGILFRSIMISPGTAARLFREGKIIIADARKREAYNKKHVVGAICLPYDELHFMELNPKMKTLPIALY